VWACSHPPQLATRMYTCDHVLNTSQIFIQHKIFLHTV